MCVCMHMSVICKNTWMEKRVRPWGLSSPGRGWGRTVSCHRLPAASEDHWRWFSHDFSQALLYARYFLPQVKRGAAMGCPFLESRFFGDVRLANSPGLDASDSYGFRNINGYESIPINTIFRGMNIHLPAIFMFTRGTRFWPTAK